LEAAKFNYLRFEELNEIYDEHNRALRRRQYDAIFSIYYQNKPHCFENETYSIAGWMRYGNLNDFETAKYLWGDFNNGMQLGTMRRRADELDMLHKGDYVREYDTTRYGDIWGKDFTWYPSGDEDA
jgi:GH24 family phage-related lysozyme (muramidase)